MDATIVLLLLGGGLAAGFVNAVAGGGSVITLPILMFSGLSATEANGTNRIAILMQNIGAVAGFRKGGALEIRPLLPLLPATLVGAVAGAWVATEIHPDAMRKVFAGVIVLVALSVLVKPSKWLGGGSSRLAEPWRSLAFLGIGFYGGFIQAGVGFLLLAGLVLGGGLGLVRGNAAKLFLTLLYTPLTLLLFAQANQLHWAEGAVLGAGNVVGALLATFFAVKKGAGWIRWVLFFAAIGAAIRMLFG
jgi:uncharacterized membrane protein YfcA